MKLREKTTATLLIAIFMASAFAFTVIASDIGGIELGSTYSGTAEWTDETVAVGDYSVKLMWPAPYRDEDNNYIVPRAFVVINIPEGMKIDSEYGVSTWSYWAKAPIRYTPQVTFYVDHPDIVNHDGKDYDTTISASLYGGDGTWTKIDEATIPNVIYGSYVLWIHGKSGPVYASSWTAIREGFDLWGDHYDFGDAMVRGLKIGKGTIGTNKDLIAYVDDFEMNGVTYEMEPTKADIVPGKGKGIANAPGLDKPLPNDNFAKGRQ